MMKYAIAFLTLILASQWAVASGKVAVVNLEQAIINTDLAQAKIAELEKDADFKANLDEAKKIQAAGKALAEKYKKEAPTLSATQKLDLESKMTTKQEDMAHVINKLKKERKKLLTQMMYQLNSKASKAVKDIIDSEGIGLLLNANPEIVLYTDTSFDITAKVTDRINKAK